MLSLSDLVNHQLQLQLLFSSQDVRTLLALPADVVGASNTTIAHGLQHRLNRVIQKLREG